MKNLRSEINSEAGQTSFFDRSGGQWRSRRARILSFLKLGLCFAALALPLASGADQPDALQILKSAATTYKSLHSYQAQIVVQQIEGSKAAESRYTEIGSGAMFSSMDSDPRGRSFGFDGEHAWTLDRAANEYAQAPASGAPASFVGQLAEIDQNVKTASLDDAEVYDGAGKLVDVYIVEVTRTAWPAGSAPGAQSAIYTIDEKTFEVYKAMTYTSGPTQVLYFSLAERNQPATQNVFTPPSGAKQVEALPSQQPVLKSIIGMEAPDFTLKDSLGHSYNLHDFRGKVVAIDFIGAWCPPCMAQAPYMQQVNDSYPPRDLEVFGLDVGENTKAVGELAFNAQFTFPLLVGAEPGVTQKYFVDDYPTVYIIGRDGRIVFKASGTDNPGGFLAAVKAAIAAGK
jgi:peroxiredoxin/outer membrane lipoprotein-sorting protein